MEYEKMLDRLYMSLPEKTLSKERFEVPEASSFIQGAKTVVRNYSQLLKIMRREEKHLFRFIAKEIGTAASVEGGSLVLNGKFSQDQVRKLFMDYFKTFVLCPECGKPDTQVIAWQSVRALKCEACGAVTPVKGL
ncbi:MAG: translation initiation factor IF-2 subunit beta [Candidatus Diapherotrites archaeon]|nr:translation initiation factor IF-2 subunit beta [Candidatus Diapherotrites archaeon]